AARSTGNELAVGNPAVLEPLVQDVQHRLLDIAGVDDAIRPDPFRQTNGHVARACADIGDRRSLLDANDAESLIGVLFRLALVAIQPFRSARVHTCGVSAPTDGMDAGCLLSDNREGGHRADCGDHRRAPCPDGEASGHATRIPTNSQSSETAAFPRYFRVLSKNRLMDRPRPVHQVHTPIGPYG